MKTNPHLADDERALAAYYVFNPEADRLPADKFSDPIARATIETLTLMDADGATGAKAFSRYVTKLDRLPCEAGRIAAEVATSDASTWTPEIAAIAEGDVLKAATYREIKHGLNVALKRIEAGEPIEEVLAVVPHHAPPAVDRKAPPTFLDTLMKGARPGPEFWSMDLPERPRLVGDWFVEADLGFVFAPRGVGKTWFAHALIAALTSGRDFGPWKVPSRVPVALLDGEMPPDEVRKRMQSLRVDPAYIDVVSHQILWDEAEATLQLGDAEQRAAILDYCVGKGIRVLVIDNLSSLSAVSENDNDEWTALGDWLLAFQRSGIAVVVVHHAGRNGNMRGASRREDRASFVVSLTDSRERGDAEEGARVTAKFTKARYARATPATMDWHFQPAADGTVEIETSAADNVSLVLEAIRSGIDSASDIAEHLDIAKGTASKAATKLEREGKIRIEGRRYFAN